jgi:predicted nucleic acid-binding protein
MTETRRYVIDSSIILLYVAGDSRVETIVNKINDGIAEGYILEQCIPEIYTKVNERFGIADANKILDGIRNSRIKVVDLDYELMTAAGELQSVHKGKLSMVTAYEIVLAKHLNGVLVTCDEDASRLSAARVELVRIKQ